MYVKTPIYDFLQNYINSNTFRLHMPGHKGKNIADLSYAMDITEINGADSLFDSSGIIEESEKNAANCSKRYGHAILPAVRRCVYRQCLL